MDEGEEHLGSGAILQVELIVASYARLLHEELFPGAPESGAELARVVWQQPSVLVSHGTQSDPLFNYGNRKALQLWEMTWSEFLGLPSRYSAETEHRSERERLLREVSERGFSRNYCGIRASKNGRRFRIECATVFNLIDADGAPAGQAATFSKWTEL